MSLTYPKEATVPLSEFLRRARVVAGAVPAWGAAITAVLASVSTSIVPLLPVAWQVKAVAIIAAILGAVATVVKVVARVALVPDEAVGLVLPEGQRLHQELVGAAWPAGYSPDNPPPGRGGVIKNHFTGTNMPADADGLAEQLRHAGRPQR